MAEFELAQSTKIPRSFPNNPKSSKTQTPFFDDEFEADSDDEFLLSDWPEELLEETEEKLPARQNRKARNSNSKRLSSDDPLKGLKKRSLSKAQRLDMPPTPVGHDWHPSDGGWNLVKSWNEKEESTGQKLKKERYAGFLSRDAWQVMKEYEYQKIIAQIGQQSR